jgi:TatD DNase family protein
MTRSLAESRAALLNPQVGLTWGIGTHPAVASSLDTWSAEEYEAQLDATPLVGEVGMDRRGSKTAQLEVLERVLSTNSSALFSVHSTGRAAEVVDIVEHSKQRGVILHWFTGSRSEIERASAAGCFFSINAAMSAEQMKALPLERVLPETDFPSARSKTGAVKPGDVRKLELAVAELTRQSLEQVRWRWYRNLADLVTSASVSHRLTPALRTAISHAETDDY